MAIQEEQLKEGQYIYDKIFKPLASSDELKIENVLNFDQLNEELQNIWAVVEDILEQDLSEIDPSQYHQFIKDLFEPEKCQKIIYHIRNCDVDDCIANEDNLEVFLFKEVSSIVTDEFNLIGSDLFILLTFISFDMPNVRKGIENKKKFLFKIAEEVMKSFAEEAKKDGFNVSDNGAGVVVTLIGVRKCKD